MNSFVRRALLCTASFPFSRRLVHLTLFLAPACVPQSDGAVPPQVAPSSTLAPAPSEEERPTPFALVHAGPRGEAMSDPTIQLVFSRPLRELGPDEPPPRGLRLSPEVPGDWQWVGAAGLTFVPTAGRLPRATEFTVSVPGDLRSLAGEQLKEPVSFSFQTPRPVAEVLAPSEWERSARPSDEILLSFSQYVRPEQVVPHLRVVAHGESVPIEVVRATGAETKAGGARRLAVRAPGGWPKGSLIEVELSPGVRSVEGPLSSTTSLRHSFETYGPLTAKVECSRNPEGRCRPDGGLYIELSNPVDARRLARSLRADGAQLHVDQDWAPGSTTRHISLGARLRPRQSFTVVLDPIVDVYGQPLAWLKHRIVEVADYEPNVRIGFEGDSLLPEDERVAIVAMNTGFQLVTAPLSGAQLAELDPLPWADKFARVAELPAARQSHIPRGALNEPVRHFVNLDDVTKDGPFVMAVRYHDGRQQVHQIRWGQRTELGMSLKLGQTGGRVWVTRLDSGAPVAGAQVRVLDPAGSDATRTAPRGPLVASTTATVSETVTTSAHGLASLPPSPALAQALSDRADRYDGQSRPVWFEARLGSKVAYRSSEDTIQGWRLPVLTDFYGAPSDLAMLFAERDLFRPGETAAFKGYVRRPASAGNQIVAHQHFELTLAAPSGDIVTTKRVTTNAFGALSEQLTLPGSGGLGHWTVSLRELAPSGPASKGHSQPSGRILAQTYVQLAEYRPAEFEVDVGVRPSGLVAGQKASWTVGGRYLFGGAMAGSAVETTLRRQETWFVPEGWEQDWVTSDAEWQSYEPYRDYDRFLPAPHGELDESGNLEFDWDATLVQQTGPERLELEATVADLSAQTQSSRTSLLVHPANYYLALKKLESTLLDVGDQVEATVAAVTPAGDRVAGRQVSVSLYRVRWTQVKHAGSSDAERTVTEPVRELVGQCALTTEVAERSCAIAVPHAGQFLLRAVSRDESGRSAATSTGFYAIGGQGAASFRDYEERGIVPLEADREVYKPGQTARILVQSPFERARAWVTIERDDVLEQRIVTLSGPAPTIAVPITDALRPNAYVSVQLLEDRAALGGKAHAVGDSYRTGVVDLRIDPEQRRLSVRVEPDRKAYQPRDEVELHFAVQDDQQRGRPSELAVFVVDEGVLSLSSYQMPDPLLAFTAPRPLRVETIESRESIAHLFGLEPHLGENKGHPGGGGEEARSESVTAAYFNPSLLTDAQGRATARFRLPDNIGRFRVMAAAVTADDRYGKGHATLTVNQKLMARPALPRFFRAGDRFTMSTVVSALGFEGGSVAVAASAEGVELAGPRSRTVQLQPSGSARVDFQAKANRVGRARLRFRVQGAGAQDEVVVERAVQSPAQLEAVALYGKTESAEAHELGDLSALRKDMGQLDVTLSSSALVGLEGGFEQLWDYPYLCSEQLASRALPLLLLRDLAALYGVEAPADADARVDTAVAQLVRRQRGDGGLGMWPESTESHPWVSAYGLWVLWEAKQRGRSIVPDVFERGSRYLRDRANERDPEHLTTAALASLVLAKLGRPDGGSVRALYEHEAELPLLARILLLWAAAETEQPEIIKPLLDQVESAVTLRGRAAEIRAPHSPRSDFLFASDTRRHALALHALVAARPEHPLAAPLARALLDARKGQGWNSTQDAAFALLALDAYRRAQEQVEPDFQAFVWLGDQLLGKRRFFGRSVRAQEFSVEMKKLASGGAFVFQRKGRGTLFYEARLAYAKKALPKAPLERGFVVKKRMVPVGATPDTEAEQPAVGQPLERGNLVLVEITVLAPTQRRYVVVEDPLPAGLEAIDLSLDTAQGSLAELLADDDAGYARAWHRTELRDDRVLTFVDDMPPGVYRYRYLARATTAGTFVTPPTRALEMYQPEVYGRTAATEVTVR